MSEPDSRLNADTLALHGGTYRTDSAMGAIAVPIYQSTAFHFGSTDRANRLSQMLEDGFTYSRIANPTVDAFEQRLAALEGGAGALAVASGQAAVATAVLTLAQAGDNIVSSKELYGGTWNLFTHRLKQFGIEARFVDADDPENFRRASDERTRLYFGEALPNPKLTVFPVREVADIGRDLGIPLIIDNTTAHLTARPLAHGAAVVVTSATKYIGGHGTTIGGAVIDGGNFPFEQHAHRHPLLAEPAPSYADRNWFQLARPFGNLPFLLRARADILRDLGPTLSAASAFQLLQGLETLPLRIRRHNDNAIAVAEYLAAHPKVSNVVFPSLQTGRVRLRADTYLEGGYGALLGFELAAGAEAAKRFIDQLKLIYHAPNIGDARTLAVHPASTIHAQLTEEARLSAGVTPGFVRLSIGIEDPADIIADIGQAIEAAD